MCTRCGRTWVTAAVEAAVEPGCGYQEKDEEEEGREKERIWIARGASWSVLHNRSIYSSSDHASASTVELECYIQE